MFVGERKSDKVDDLEGFSIYVMVLYTGNVKRNVGKRSLGPYLVTLHPSKGARLTDRSRITVFFSCKNDIITLAVLGLWALWELFYGKTSYSHQ